MIYNEPLKSAWQFQQLKPEFTREQGEEGKAAA